MSRLILIGTLLLSGCAKHVVRNAAAYQAEVEWNTLSLERSAELLELAAKERLEDGDREGCLEMAEVAVVLKARAAWHAAMSLHLAGLGDDPGDEPSIPEADTLCGEGE